MYSWLDKALPLHSRLSDAVVNILQNLLSTNDIDYLSVSGRTKDRQSILDKIERKNYKKPKEQLTDLSGIRVIVNFESDIKKVSELIDKAFKVDTTNSLNQDEKLSVNQTGYRSVHFVCDLGSKRSALPEFENLSDLKFEIQVRTVLQHAWAELAHDSNYKFNGKLPPQLERKLFLYAGMLEIADGGFDELSKSIDEYISQVNDKTVKGEFDYNLDSISLSEFVSSWALKNDMILEPVSNKTDKSPLVNELNQFGVFLASDLNSIIPDGFVDKCKEIGHKSTIFGYIRDWMIINNYKKFVNDVDFDWIMAEPDYFKKFIDDKDFNDFYSSFEWEGDEQDFDSDLFNFDDQ